MVDELKEVNKNIKELAQNVKQSFEKIGSRVGKEINDVLTPELQDIKGVFDDVTGATKDSGKALLNFFGSGLTDDAKGLQATEKTASELDTQTELMRGTTVMKGKGMHVQNKHLDEAMKRQNKLAEEQLAINKRKERKDRGTIMKGKSTWWKSLLFWLIGIPVAAIAGALGVILGFILQPFNVIRKMLKAFRLPKVFISIGKVIRGIGRFFVKIGKAILNPKIVTFFTNMFGKGGKIASIFTKIFGPTSKFGKLFKFIGKGFKIIRKFFKPLAKLFGWIVRSPFFKKFVIGAFMKGFSKIFWPIQIIMSIVDFVKGFMDTEGNILDKIQGGIKNVIVKFFQWPLELIGKLWDWIMTKLGFENMIASGEGGTAAMLVEGLGKGIDMVFKGYKLIFGLLWDALKPAIEWLSTIDYGGIWGIIKNVFSYMAWIPLGIKNWILDFFNIDKEKFNEEPVVPGEVSEHERRRMGLKNQEDTAINRQIAEKVKVENAMSEETAKFRKKLLKLQKEAGEMPIVVPPPSDPKPNSLLSDNPDGETFVQNTAQIHASGM